MKALWKSLLTLILLVSLMFNFWVVVFLNGYFKFLWTSADIMQSLDGEEKGTGKFKANVLEESLKKSYTSLSRKLWGKYYFDNSSRNKIIIKKVYYLEGQKVKAKVIFKDKDNKVFNNVRFDDIVKKKNVIETVEIWAINGKILPQSIQLNGESLGVNDFVTTLE